MTLFPKSQGDQNIGHYRILRKLGEGGMGSVYEAENLSIARRVAIKVLHPSCSNEPESLARFYNEARAANLIDHPSVVQVLDYGRKEDGCAYFVMELLKGETLRSRIDRSQQTTEIAVDEVLRIGRQLASTLAAAHSCGIVHRDLKPENIMLVPDSEATDGQRVKILDFGIAKLSQWVDAAAVRTRTNVIVGTPAYMAPEQCRGAALVDERADVYSLGVVLFELLAGRRPFLGSSSGEYMGQHLFCAPPRLDSLVPGISAELAALTAALLRKEREDRPYMAEVLTSLEGMCAPLLAKSALLPLERQQRPRPSRAGLGPLPVRRAVRWRAPARSVALSGIAMLGIAALSSSAHQGAWSPAPRQEDKADTAPAPAESREDFSAEMSLAPSAGAASLPGAALLAGASSFSAAPRATALGSIKKTERRSTAAGPAANHTAGKKFTPRSRTVPRDGAAPTHGAAAPAAKEKIRSSGEGRNDEILED